MLVIKIYLYIFDIILLLNWNFNSFEQKNIYLTITYLKKKNFKSCYSLVKSPLKISSDQVRLVDLNSDLSIFTS